MTFNTGVHGDDNAPSSPTLANYSASLSQWATAAKPLDSLLHTPVECIDRQKLLLRERIFESLGRLPLALNQYAIRTTGVAVHRGLRIESLEYEVGYGPGVAALLLTPEGGRGPYPGFLALHDHGGFKFYGKEKLVEQPDDEHRPCLLDFRKAIYEGQCWASELARRGYAVLVHDVFTWGSRRLRSAAETVVPECEREILQYNGWANFAEAELTKALMTSGRTMMGIILHEDSVALGILSSRPEVDSGRIGCGGLSGGALRTIFLAGLNPKIKAAVCAGFLPTLSGIAGGSCYHHTFMAFMPSMANHFDFADVLGLRAPLATYVLQCADDELFPRSCMHVACESLKKIYSLTDRPEMLQTRFFPGRHQLTREMFTSIADWLHVRLACDG